MALQFLAGELAAGTSLLALLPLVALAAYGFYISQGGRAPFRVPIFQE